MPEERPCRSASRPNRTYVNRRMLRKATPASPKKRAKDAYHEKVTQNYETSKTLLGIRGDDRDWVACRMGLYDGGRGAGWPTGRPREEPWHHDRTGPGQPLGADRRRQVLRPGAPAALAGGGALSRLRQRIRGPGRLRRDPAAAAALPLQGVCGALRRPHRHRAGRASPAAAALGACCACPSWA